MGGITDFEFVEPYCSSFGTVQSTVQASMRGGGGSATRRRVSSADGGATGAFVVLGQAPGYAFSPQVAEVVAAMLQSEGVTVQRVEVEEDDHCLLRLTVQSAEAQRRLLDMHHFDYTDDIRLTFTAPAGRAPTPVAAAVPMAQGPTPLGRTFPVCVRGLPSRTPATLQRIAAYVAGQEALTFQPTFADDSMVGTGEAWLDCGCPEDANALLALAPGSVAWQGSLLSFSDPGLKAVVADEDARAMLSRLEPQMRETAIKDATGVSVRVDASKWAAGQALVTATSHKDYDTIVHGPARTFGGRTLTFTPLLYPVSAAAGRQEGKAEGSRSPSPVPEALAMAAAHRWVPTYVREGATRLDRFTDITSVLVLQDGQNCYFNRHHRLRVPALKDGLRTLVLDAVVKGGATDEGRRYLSSHRFEWQVVLPDSRFQSRYEPSPKVYQDLQQAANVTSADGTKGLGGVDEKVIQSAINFADKNQGVKGVILVLIAGDRDFNMMLERAQSMGIRTVLIHANNVGATRAIEAYTDFVFAGAWPKLLRMFSIPGSPEADGEEKAAQVAKVGKVGKGKPGKPTAASGGGGGAGGGAAATDAQPDLIQVETTAPVSMFAQIHRGLVASKLAAEVRLGNDEEDDDSDPANRLTIATSRVDKKAFVTVATPPTTSPTIRSKLAGALKAYLIGLDRSKRVVPLSGVTSDSLLNGNVKTELFQYAREKEAFFFIPRGAGNTTDEQGAATVIVIGHTPTAVAEAHQFLLKYERSSKTVPLSGSYVSGFVQRKMPEYKEEAERRFDVELEMVGEGKERSLVLTGRSPSVAKAEKWLTTTLKQIRYEKLPVGDCALRPEDMVSAIKVARRAALAEIRSQDMVEGAEESGATDDDASTDSAPASATPSRFLISIFRPQQGQFIVCVGHRDHLQIAVDKVKEMVLSVVRDTAAGLSPEAVRAHGLETPAGRETFQQQFNLHSVSYDMAKRRVTLMGPASEVQSAIEQLKQTENATDYCYLTDASLAGFYRSKPFQDELRRAIGTEKDVKVSTTHKDSSNVKKVVCLRGPKGAVDQLQPRVQATLDTLLRRVTDGLWHVSPAKFAFLKDEKEAVSGIARAKKVLVSFLDKPDAECVESPPVPRPRTSVPTQPKHYPLREGCVLEVLNMDMSRLYVGCLVNPANEQLRHAGGLARVISMAGGPIVERESRDIVSRHGGRLKTGQVVHTSPGNLSQSGVRRLLHVVVPKTSEEGHVKLLGTAVAECLRQCDETPRAEPAAQGGGSSAVSRLASMFGGAIGSRPAPSAPVSSDAVDSIAFTLMGSGIYGWDEGTSARTILRAINDYFSGARSGGRLKRVVIFDQDQHKWETAIHEADKTFGNGVLGLARRMVATPAVTPGPAPPTARPLLPPKPQPPVKPSHVFYWNNAAGNPREDTGNCVWVPYDYDQCMAILNAEAAGQKNVHVTGDRIGQLSDTRHKDPETGRGEYVVHFNYQGTTHMVQTNRVSKFERLVMSKPVVTDADLPPLYDKALQRYHDALLAWGQQQRQQQQHAQGGGGGGGGAAVVQGLRPASAPRPTKAVQLTGFATNVEGVKRALQQLLADNTREMEGEGILLPAFLSLDTVKEDIAALLDQYEAEIVVAGSGLHGSSMLRVRALGEIARVRVAHHLQAAISREEKDVVPKGWVMREATPGKELNLVELAQTDPEYQAAKARFLAHGFTCGGVTKIERVENPELYREYVTKRRLITAQLKEAGIADGGRTEWVVHCTRTTSPAAVCGDINGLSPNYCERGMYGRAVYLSENTAYSDAGYAHDLGNGLHQLMLVEMVVGRIDERTAGDPNIKKPKDWHHTIAGPVGGNYRAYMKYEPYHTYPTHIITYRKK